MCMIKCAARVVSHPSSVMLHHPIFEANLKERDHKCRKSLTFFFLIWDFSKLITKTAMISLFNEFIYRKLNSQSVQTFTKQRITNILQLLYTKAWVLPQ